MATASPSRWIDPSPVPAPTAGRILVLSRGAWLSGEFEQRLRSANFAHLAVGSIETAMETLRVDSAIDLVMLDSDSDSKQLFSWVEQFSGLQTTAATGARLDLVNGDRPIVLLLIDPEHVPQTLQSLESGTVYNYVVRPFSDAQLLESIKKAIEYRRLKIQNDYFRHHLEQQITARTRMLQQTMQQLEQSYDVTLEALGNALDLKDAETEGHSKRVTAYTLALGRAIGLNEPQLRVVGRGAFLHDIGKMAIPDAILRKPGKLTDEEREIMRTHSELGYRMIRKIPYLREAAEIVYAHQECFDGSGYPRGLRGEQIPIGARIFALADTLDAITSNRPYRKAATVAQARQEVLRCAGTQFDPAIVDVFVATPDSIWLNLREGIMRDGPEFSPFGYTFGEVG